MWYFPLIVLVQLIQSTLIVGSARYGQNITTDKGNCNFESGAYTRFASVGPKVFENSGACGLCIQVKTPKGVVTAGVVDLCLGCEPNDILLDFNSFNKIGDVKLGVAPIQWQPVPCRAAGGIRFKWIKGSGSWWSGLGIRNAAAPVKTLEVFLNNKWVPIKREYYNYFTMLTPGPGPFKFRLTSYFNEVIIEESVPLLNVPSFKSKQQFRNVIKKDHVSLN